MDYDEESELRAMVVALTREYRDMVVPLLERLTQIEARSSGPLRAELARLMDDLPDDMRKRLKARFDALD